MKYLLILTLAMLGCGAKPPMQKLFDECTAQHLSCYVERSPDGWHASANNNTVMGNGDTPDEAAENLLHKLQDRTADRIQVTP